MREFVSIIPKGSPQVAMGSITMQIAIGAFCLWQFAVHGAVFWAFAALLAAGSS